MTIENFRAFVAAASWRPAEASHTLPHEFLTRPRFASDRQAFAEAVAFIHSAGKPRVYGGRIGRYLDCDGRTYWAHGAPADAVPIINRGAVDVVRRCHELANRHRTL